MADYQYIVVDEPIDRIRRLTLNRPQKRNALSNALRGELFAALEAADRDDSISVMVLRGAGPCFSAGYDLASDLSQDQPFYTAAASAIGRGMSLKGVSGFGTWQSRSSLKFMSTASLAGLNSPRPVISSMWPTTH